MGVKKRSWIIPSPSNHERMFVIYQACETHAFDEFQDYKYRSVLHKKIRNIIDAEELKGRYLDPEP